MLPKIQLCLCVCCADIGKCTLRKASHPCVNGADSQDGADNYAEEQSKINTYIMILLVIRLLAILFLDLMLHLTGFHCCHYTFWCDQTLRRQTAEEANTSAVPKRGAR